MKTSSRLILWALVAYLVPVGIFIYDKGFNRDAFWWMVFIAVLGGGYEIWHHFNTRKK